MSKNTEKITTCTYFPQELLTDIISRLPVKTIVRLRCVCKLWCSFINDPTFISMHLNSTTINNNSYIMRMTSCDTEPYVLHCDTRFIVRKKLVMPTVSHIYHIVGSCNGLLCISDGYNKTLLWNPSIKRFKALPFCQVNPFPNTGVILGFGFCLKSNDYKVVQISFCEQLLVQVYTLSTNSWKTIAADIPCIKKSYYQPVYMNGVCHWRGNDSQGLSDEVILSFDFADEVFREIMLPTSFLEADDELEGFLGVHKECLSYFTFPDSYPVISAPYHHELWVMKEYGVVESWVKLYTVEVELRELIEMPVAFGYDSEILAEDHVSGKLVSLNMETKQFKNLGIRHDLGVHTYEESLVLLDGETVSEG